MSEKNSLQMEEELSANAQILPKSPATPTHAKTIEDATKIGFRLPTLSQRTMVYSESSGTDVLLQTDESNGMDELAKEYYQHVRWDFSSERVNFVLLTVKKPLRIVAIVFFNLIICRSGHTTTLKFFPKQPMNMKASAIAGTEKLNLPCLTN